MLFWQIVLTVLLLFLWGALHNFLRGQLHRFARKRHYLSRRTMHVEWSVRLFCLLGFALAVALVWGVDFRGFYLFTSGVFALIGIAFFAVWSVLSNITAGLLLFFQFPYKVGDYLEVLDTPNARGVLVELTLFNLILERDDQSRVAVPNNLAVQKIVAWHKPEATAPKREIQDEETQ